MPAGISQVLDATNTQEDPHDGELFMGLCNNSHTLFCFLVMLTVYRSVSG